MPSTCCSQGCGWWAGVAGGSGIPWPPRQGISFSFTVYLRLLAMSLLRCPCLRPGPQARRGTGIAAGCGACRRRCARWALFLGAFGCFHCGSPQQEAELPGRRAAAACAGDVVMVSVAGRRGSWITQTRVVGGQRVSIGHSSDSKYTPGSTVGSGAGPTARSRRFGAVR